MRSASKSSRRGLLLMILALAVAAWSGFLWWELAKSRTSGADPFCAFGDPGACGELWNASFAAFIHLRSGIPVAGWGAVWGLAALAVAFVGRREGTSGALRWMALGGLAAMAGLLLASAVEGLFCSSCSVVYVLTALFGWVALGKDEGTSPGRGGWTLALGALAAAYLVLLVPGLRTPKGAAGEARRALAAAARAGQGDSPPPSAALQGTSGLPPRFTAGPGTGDPDRDRRLNGLVGSLSPQLRQLLSDTLVSYDRAPALAEGTPRAADGPAGAPVRIVEFTDTLCSHCATLHETLHQLRELAPSGSFSVDRRYYPLDGNCNRNLPVRGPETLRCLTARAKICMENRAGSGAFVEDLYRSQENLTEERFWEIAGPYMPQTDLETCMADPAVAAALEEDVALAARYNPRGTPLVVLNGKKASAFSPLLYALILTGGSVSHPAFAALPAPSR